MALFTTNNLDKTDQSKGGIIGNDDTNDYLICKGPEKLKGLINKIKENKTTWYVSDGDWSMHDLVMELLKKYKPADLWITTYALRETSVRQILMAQDRGDLNEVKMVIDYRAKVRTPEVFQLAANNINQICLTAIHAKATILKTKDHYISIIGSANWTSNPRIEAGVVTMDETIGKFNVDWIEKVMNDAEPFK